jgi:hypothetical protein
MSKENLLVPSFIYWLFAPFVLTRMAFEKRNGVFLPLERAILDAVLSSTPTSVTQPLRSQLSEINHAVRVTAKYTEVILHKIKGIKPDFSRSDFLPGKLDEQTFATVTGEIDNKKIAAKFLSIDGCFFSIEFSSDVRKFAKRNDFVVTEVRIAALE